MKHKLLNERDGWRSYVLIFERGDEVMDGLVDFAASTDLAGAHFHGIGAFRDAVLAYFDWDTKEYERIPVDEQVEVTSISGNISRREGEPAVHAHVSLATRAGTGLGGHLMRAHTRPTLELFLTESPERLVRAPDEESGLALLRP